MQFHSLPESLFQAGIIPPHLWFAGVEDVFSESVNNSAVSPLNLSCALATSGPRTSLFFTAFLHLAVVDQFETGSGAETMRNIGATELISLSVPPSPSASFTH